MNTRALFSVLSFALLAPAVARAEDAPPPSTFEAESFWRGELAYRGSFVTDPGLNPFSTHDDFGQLSLLATRTVAVRGRWSFATGLLWEYGRSRASARGADAALAMHRLAVPLELRLHFFRSFYAFARAAPGAARESASVDDPSAPATLSKAQWVPSLDASLGGSYRVFGDRTAAVWATSDVGYGWTGAGQLVLSPELADDDPRRTGDVDLGRLAMRGIFLRVGVAVTF